RADPLRPRLEPPPERLAGVGAPARRHPLSRPLTSPRATGSTPPPRRARGNRRSGRAYDPGCRRWGRRRRRGVTPDREVASLRRLVQWRMLLRVAVRVRAGGEQPGDHVGVAVVDRPGERTPGILVHQ